MKSKLLAFLVGVGLAVPVFAAVFNQFGPVTGVLKGNASSPITTAAISSDIIAMWTGTCNASSFLAGNGTCAVPAGTGVTSVGLTMPTGFSVTGSPVTGAGTLAVTTTLNGPLRGNGSAFITGNTSLTTEVSGTLPVANGGTNLTASADDNIMVGNGTTWQTKAVPSCTDTAGNHLNYDTSTNTVSCGTSSSVTAPTGANPTGTIGLTAVNGAAATFLRSDGAPALSQAITPTWTGIHTFTNTTANTVLNNAGAATDQKNTIVRVIGTGSYAVQSASDAAPTTSVTNLIAGARTGAAWSSLSLGNATDNTTFSFLGTGTTAIGGGQVTNSNTGTSFNPLAFCATGQAAGSRCWGFRIGGAGDFQIDVASDAGAPGNSMLSSTRSGTAVSTVSLGNATDNPTFAFLGTGLTTFSGNVLVSLSSGRVTLNDTSATGNALVAFQSNGTTKGFAGVANAANQCITGSATGDICVRAESGKIILSADAGASVGASLTSAGVFNVKSGGDLQVNAVSVCLSNGTNCPSATGTSGTFTATLSTGCTTSPTTTGRWAKIGSIVVINYGSITCTSNATTKAFDASIPAAERPAASVATAGIMAGDNGAKTVACPRIATTGVLDFDSGGTTGSSCAGASWTSSGTFSLPGFSVSYQTAN